MNTSMVDITKGEILSQIIGSLSNKRPTDSAVLFCNHSTKPVAVTLNEVVVSHACMDHCILLSDSS